MNWLRDTLKKNRTFVLAFLLVETFYGADSQAAESASRERLGPTSGLEATSLPLRQVERKARTEKAGSSARSVQSSAVAAASVPRRVIPKDGVAPEIAALAASLDNSPAEIFRFVHDQIDFDPKWGAEKSPLGTLHERQGTSWDQAWLLQQLLTAAGVDAWLEWGEVEIPAEMLRNITGVEDPWRAGDLMTTAGTPIVLVVEGSQVKTARLSHVWVKAYLDYFPNRGATAGPGDTWIRMDPSLKRFAITGDLRLDEAVPYDLGEYLQSGTELSPRHFYEAALDAYVTANHPEISDLEELKRTKSVVEEAFPFVPGTLRGKILSVEGESVEMPEAFQQKLKLEVREAGGSVLVTYETPWPAVYGQRLELAWPGATSSDQATLDLYGGVFSTPPFEVDLKPSIRVEGVEVAAGSAIGSAEDVVVQATWTTPQGLETSAPFELWAGEHAVFTVDFGRLPQEVVDRYGQEAAASTDPSEQEAWNLAHAAALELRTLGGDLAHLSALRWQRLLRLGTAVLAVQRGAVSVAPDGTPLTYNKGPVSLDLGAMPLGLFPADGVAAAGDPVSTVPTLELLGSQGSFLEGEALAAVFGGDQVTGVTFLTRAVRDGQTLTRVDAANVDAALEAAELSEEAEASVRAAVGRGWIAWIPESQLPVETWDTTGYVLEDPDTGAGGYFVTYERVVTPLDGAVAFHAPADLDVVTAPTDVVATIDVEALESWTLSTRPTGGGASQVIATGTGQVDHAVLGRFDPTLLVNGMHDLVLTGTNAAGQTATGTISVVVEGGMKVGHFTLSYVDLKIPLSGLDIEIHRTYDSRRRKEPLDFGYGWSLDVAQGSYQNNRPPGDGWQILASGLPCTAALETKSHLTTVRLSDDEVYRFRLGLVQKAPLLGGCQARAVFQYVDGPLPGATLEILGNDLVIYQNGANRLLYQDSFGLFEPESVRLTTRDGRIYHLNLGTGVTHLEDLNGNSLESSPDGITHSSGVGIDFIRDAAGRIQEIRDPRGHANLYSYDGAGDLVQHTDRVDSETAFVYREHYLEEIHNALGVRAVRNEYDEDGRLIRHIDAEGNVIELGHDLDQRVELETDRLGHTSLMGYDVRGNIVREVDALGAEVERTFDDRDNLLTEKDPLGRVTTFTYTSGNLLASRTNALRETTRFTYNERGQVVTQTDPEGRVTASSYDEDGNLLSTTDALGHATSFTYDASGNLLSTTDALGYTTQMTYDARGNQLSETDSLGQVTTFTYDSSGNRLTESRTRTLPDGSTESLTTHVSYDPLGRGVTSTAADGSVTRTSFDALGRVVGRTDPLGRVTTMGYDTLDRLTTMTFPDGTTAEQVYDAEGRTMARIERGGQRTEMAYDAAGRLVMTTFADEAQETQTFDAAGQLLTSTDARGNTTTFAYDVAGRQIGVTDALDQATSFEYDAVGNQTARTDPRGYTTEFAYDGLDRLVSTTFPDGTRAQVGYDAFGRRVQEIDPAGVITKLDYDALGRLVAVTDGLDQVTAYTYDEVGNRLTQTDANGHTTTFEYDRMGRRTARVLPDGSRESMTYNADGTLASRTDFAGRTTTFAYDASQRLLQRTFADGVEHLFTYTASGKRQTATDPRGVTTYAYDARDRLVAKQDPSGQGLTYAYDLQGNLTRLTATVGGASYKTLYGYDALNRLVSITDPQGQVSSHSYDANGNRASLNHANGLVTTYEYDSLNRLNRLETLDGSGQVVQSYAYTLAATGHRTRIDEADGTARAYQYDALYHLTQDRVTDPAGNPEYQHDFVYDPVGNRLSQVVDEGPGSSSVPSTFDVRDRLLTAGPRTYGWDANGNMTSRDGEVFTWNDDQRMTSAQRTDGTVVETVYDVDGYRVQNRVTSPAGEIETTDYLLDTRGLLGHVVAEVVAESVATVYVRSDDELISLFRPASNQAKHYLEDGLGTVRLLSDSAGNVTDRYEYTAFGNLTERTGDDPQPYQFVGEPFDARMSFYYNRARWMDPREGRFLSADPRLGTTEDPRTLHRYMYAAQDPVNLTDPTGEQFLIFLRILSLMNTKGTEDQRAVLGNALVMTDWILSTDNNCSRYFCGGSAKGGGQSPAVQALYVLTPLLTPGHTTNISAGIALSDPWTDVVLSSNGRKSYRRPTAAMINVVGPFFARHNLSAGRNNYQIGQFDPNTNQARVLMLLHELAHMVYDPNSQKKQKLLIEDDGGDDSWKSTRNTRIVQKACLDQIKAVP